MSDQDTEARPPHATRGGWGPRITYLADWVWAQLTAWLGALFWLCFWLVVAGSRGINRMYRRWQAARDRMGRPPVA